MISSIGLAKLCELSQGTVDRALHNRPGISAATRQRILDLAKKHEYRPHHQACIASLRASVHSVVIKFAGEETHWIWSSTGNITAR